MSKSNYYYTRGVYPVYMIEWLEDGEVYESLKLNRTLRGAKLQAKDILQGMGCPCRIVKVHNRKAKPVWYSK